MILNQKNFIKNLVTDFLKKTYYEPNHFINTKGRNDLVIHNGNKAKSSVGVIIEAKKPTNKAEMLKAFVKGDTPEKIAFQNQCQSVSRIDTLLFERNGLLIKISR